MKKALLKFRQWTALLAGASLLAGCSTVKNPSGVGVTVMNADEQGFVAGTGVESQDIASVTDYMARNIINIPQISNAKTPPNVLIEQVKNDTRFPMNHRIFMERLRARLNSKALGKVNFLDRESMPTLERERELKQAGQVTSSSDPNVVEFRGFDYLLKGTLTGSSTRTSSGLSDYVLYTFRLVDARTSVIVWEDMKEIKKQGLEDAAYR